MFSQACVCPQGRMHGEGRGVSDEGRMHGEGGMHGGGGTCSGGGMRGRGHAWQER